MMSSAFLPSGTISGNRGTSSEVAAATRDHDLMTANPAFDTRGKSHDASTDASTTSSGFSKHSSSSKRMPHSTEMNTSSWQWYTSIAFVPVLLISLWIFTIHFAQTSMTTIHDRHIALIIAHPDDEAMFFAPTLLALSKPELGNTIQVVCLSSGNADNLGEIRKGELSKSCEMLGIPLGVAHAVQCIEHPLLPDSMSTSWPATTISSELSKSLSSNPQIDTLITFDRYGISSHPNHISLLHGAKEYIQTVPHPHPLLLYTLSTVSLPRKYASFFDAVVTLLERWMARGEGFGGEGAPKEVLFFSGWKEYRTAQRAMVHGHQSQMRWFRWGWILLSRYMVINDLKLFDLAKV